MRICFLLLIAALRLMPAVRGEVETPPAIAVMIEGHLEPEPRILAAVWPDGEIIWSKNATDGGPPFLVARVDAAKVREFLARLEKEQVFRKNEDFLVHLGPDASYHTLRLRSGKQQVELSSWHELFEENPKLIATSHGIEPLDGRKRDEVLRADTKEYQAFRQLWHDIRSFTKGLVPKEGKPYGKALKLAD